MRRYKIKKKITAFLFFVILIGFSIVNAVYTFSQIKNEKGNENNLLSTANVDAQLAEKVLFKYPFIEMNGLVYEVLNKKEMNNFSIFKDDKGMLYLEDYADYATRYYNEARDMSVIADKLKELNDYFKNKGTEMLFLLYPDKVPKGNLTLPNGYPYQYANESMDLLKETVKDEIPYLDLREVEGIKKQDNTKLFYKGDHHWKVETAFVGFQNLVKTFKTQFQIDLDPRSFYTQLDNYNQVLYPSSFIGSIAQKTGMQWGGVDDFTFIYPKYSTSFSYSFTMGQSEEIREGKFEYALMNTLYFNEKEKYGPFSDTYASYLYGNSGYASIKNHTNKNGVKVLFIKDSFSLPMVSFFANTVEQVDLLDPRFYDKDIPTLLQEKEYDYVVFGYSESVLQEEYIPDVQ